MATITVKRTTRERFKRLCLKVETYDKFLNRLLNTLEVGFDNVPELLAKCSAALRQLRQLGKRV